MEESLKRTIYSSDMESEYDEHAKRLLSHKIILAHILVNTVSEFSGMTPEQVVPLIEETPKVSTVPADPGETNYEKNMPVITGNNTESSIAREGKVTYDIHFFAWTPEKRGRMKILLDVEAQKKFQPGYHIVSRGIFYTSRMISSQLGTEFKAPDYDNIKKVYSIWICMNVTERVSNTIAEFSINKKDLVGDPGYLGRYDLLSVIIIGLSKELAEETDGIGLHRLLGALFSTCLSAEEKKNILSEEFKIPMDTDMERRINFMCNLGEGIAEDAMERGWKKGLEKGIEQGIEQGMEKLIVNFLKNNNHVSVAAKMLDIPETMILSVAQKEGIETLN